MQPIVSATAAIALQEALKIIRKAKKNKRRTPVVAVAMFDLVGSTQLKRTVGHSRGTQTAIEHNLMCETIARKFGGSAIKYMGDGVFIEFDDPSKACLAAVEIRNSIAETNRFTTKVGITFGMVERMEIGGIPDLLGTTVDRCARLTSLALPSQILIDAVLYGAAESFLRDDPNLHISDATTRKAKGFDDLVVCELSSKGIGFVGFGPAFFDLVEEGRPPLDEKISFLATAEEELIEVGVGLTSFSGYFRRRRPSEFKETIDDLLNRGVSIRCLMLDPETDMARIYVNENKEPEYLNRMRDSLQMLKEIKEDYDSVGLHGFHIMTYDAIPRFHVTCADLDTPHGKMSVSHYLRGITRASTPAARFSRMSNPELFEKYAASLKSLLDIAREVR